MLERRHAYGLTQDVMNDLGGPSDALVRDLEKGHYRAGGMRAGTLGKIDVAYGWQPGGAEAILRGDDPSPTPGWPHNLVRSVRARVVHGAGGAPGGDGSRARRILALWARLEQEAFGETSPAASGHQTTGVDEVIDRHRQALLTEVDDRFEQLRSELHGLRDARG